jgi:hypothetical protein
MQSRRKLRVAHILPAILIGAAVGVAACSDEGETITGGAGASSSGSGSGTSSSTTGTGGAGGSGGAGGAGAAGGAGGAGGSGSPLWVGVGKQTINPTIVESQWDDKNGDGYFDPSTETFTDTNGNGKFDATWMAGFGTGRPATGQNDDLEVRAIAFKQNGQTVVIAILDAIGYFIEDMDLIRADPKVKALGIDHVMIGATHVHEGVDTVGMWGQDTYTSGLDEDYQKLTRDKTAQAIEDAVKSLQPVNMRVAQVQTVDPASKSTMDYVNDTRDPVVYDPTVTIAQFTDAADPKKTVATLVNWAAHPEYSGSKNHMLSADYVHWLREVTENGLPAQSLAGLGGTTVFVQGPLGGQVGPGGGTHPIGPDGTPISQSGLPKAQAAGTNVAKLVLDAIKSKGEDVQSDGIVYREKEMFAEVDNLGYYALSQLGVLQRKFYNYDMSQPPSPENPPQVRSQTAYLQIGPLAMITAPGELHPELWVGGYDGSWSWGHPILTAGQPNSPDLGMAPKAPYLREIMLQNPGVKYAFVAGLTQDFLGYIVAGFNFVLDPQNPYFAEAAGDHYEETNSIGPKCEEQLQHPMLDLAKAP